MSHNNSGGRALKPLLPQPRSSTSGVIQQPQPPRLPPKPKRQIVKAACESCRQRKAKCDAQRPRCSACTARDLTCKYVTQEASETRASALKRRHDEFQDRLDDHENVYRELLTRPLSEATEILRRIRGSSVQSMARDISDGELLLQMGSSKARALDADPASLPPHRRIAFLEDSWQSTRDMNADQGFFVDLSTYTLPVARWTSVPVSEELLNHLLLLFWTWDTMVNRVIDRDMFERDMRSLDPNSARPPEIAFCTPFLVNALLALACLYTTNNEAFEDPDDPLTRGVPFINEAQRLLELENDQTSLSVAQGLMAMYVWTGNLGDLTTWHQRRVRVNAAYIDVFSAQRSQNLHHTGLERAADKQEEALARIQWGFYIADWKNAISFRTRKEIKRPTRPKVWRSDMYKGCPSDEWWFAHPLSSVPRESWKLAVFDAECTLAELAEDTLEFLNPIGDEPLPKSAPHLALALYGRLTDLRLGLPEALSREHTVLPSALQLHVNIDMVAVTILSAFDEHEKEEFGPFHPKTTSYMHASSMMSVLWSLRALYTARHEFWHIQQCSVAALRVIFDLDWGPMQLETFRRACYILQELSETFPLAQDVLHHIRGVVRQRGLAPGIFSANIADKEVSATAMRLTAVPVTFTANGTDKQILSLADLLSDVHVHQGPD